LFKSRDFPSFWKNSCAKEENRQKNERIEIGMKLEMKGGRCATVLVKSIRMRFYVVGGILIKRNYIH
jgi:hypothetical protein